MKTQDFTRVGRVAALAVAGLAASAAFGQDADPTPIPVERSLTLRGNEEYPTGPTQAMETAKQRGDKIENKTLYTLDNEEIEFEDIFEDDQPLVVLFYRGSWCGFCRGHLSAMARAKSRFDEAGAKVIAVSPELPSSQKKTFSSLEGLEFYHDPDGHLAHEFGVLWANEGYVERLTSYNGNSVGMIPLGCAYVVDPNMTIRWNWLSEKYQQRAYPHDVINGLDNDPIELDENGEVIATETESVDNDD